MCFYVSEGYVSVLGWPKRCSVEEPANWPLISIPSVFLLLIELPVFSGAHGYQARNNIFQLPLKVGHITKFWPMGYERR